MRIFKSNKDFHTLSQVDYSYTGEYVVYYKNAIVYYKDDMLHRMFGPAVKSKDGTFEMYFQNSKLHNLYDAAIIHSNSVRFYFYLNGVFMTKEEWSHRRIYYMSKLGDLL